MSGADRLREVVDANARPLAVPRIRRLGFIRSALPGCSPRSGAPALDETKWLRTGWVINRGGEYAGTAVCFYAARWLGAVGAAEKFSSSNVDVRTVIGFKASEAAVQRYCRAAGWWPHRLQVP